MIKLEANIQMCVHNKRTNECAYVSIHWKIYLFIHFENDSYLLRLQIIPNDVYCVVFSKYRRIILIYTSNQDYKTEKNENQLTLIELIK